ncbi:hypothetical protein [Halorarum halobium]|uniref:hypothetical protein n=1 Tax=Halorarum halobium TaxID=3075121 RepID=UPI0028AFC6EA|nr:hypothetical protein [Halobaculum sp. XH14]
MSPLRLSKLLVVCAVLTSSVAVAVAPATAVRADVQISSVTVTPDDPVTGERVTIETTVSNLETSSETVKITDVYLRRSGTTDEYGRVADVGSVAPGGSVSVPLRTTFDSPGQKRLTAHVVVQDESGDYRSYSYPVYVDVADPTVKAELSSTAVPNRSDTTEVTLTNFGNTNLSDVEITASAGGETIERNLLFDIAPETSRSTAFDTGNVSAGAVTFTASYTAAGTSHTATHTVDVADDGQVEGEIRLTGIETTRLGGQLTIQGDAANIGGTDTESVLVRIPDGESVSPVSPSGEYFIGAIDASEFATFELTGDVESGTSSVPVEITYLVDGERVRTTQTLEIGSTNASPPGGMGQPGGNGGQPGEPPQQGGSGGLPLLPIGAVLALVVIGGAVYRWRNQ